VEVKDRILAKAADLFMRYGIKSITMDEIATSLGISKKTIYQFFTDKDDLVFAVIGQEINENERECTQFRTDAENAVHEIFLAVEDLDELLRYTNPLVLYDLEKYHPRAYQKIKDFKYQFLHAATVENLRRGIEEGFFRNDLQKDIVAKSRVEAAFLVFNPDVFPHGKYSMSEVNFQLAILFLHGVTTTKGEQLIEKYTNERNKKLSHEQKV
jgi:TetR/AcrR family transcriptional regulator, cholesterol catabolism regulator